MQFFFLLVPTFSRMSLTNRNHFTFQKKFLVGLSSIVKLIEYIESKSASRRTQKTATVTCRERASTCPHSFKLTTNGFHLNYCKITYTPGQVQSPKSQKPAPRIEKWAGGLQNPENWRCVGGGSFQILKTGIRKK